MTRMKQRITCMILLAGLVTMLASCAETFNKKTSSQGSISVSALGGPDTKTSYSGQFYEEIVNNVTHKYERIDWVAGDWIRIYSTDKTQVGDGVVTHSSDIRDHYDYQILSVEDAVDRKSNATIDKPNEGEGLTWVNDPYHVLFYGTYPPLAATYENGKLKSFTGMTIPRDQTAPVDMSHAYMLAAPAQFVPSTQLDESGNNIPKMHMDFYPAFNAFDIVLGSQIGEIGIDAIELVTNTSDGYLSGSYSYNIYNNNESQLTNGPIVNGIVYDGSDNEKSVKVTLPSGTKIKPGGDPVKVTLLTLPPQTGTGLTNMVLNVYHDGRTKPASLKLKYNETTNNGAWLTFPAFHKARITGLALNVLPDEIEFKFVVQPWDQEAITIDTSTGSLNMSNVTWMNTKVKLTQNGEEVNTVLNNKYTVNMYLNPYVQNTTNGQWSQYSGYYPAQGYFTVYYPVGGKFKIGLIPAYGQTEADLDKDKYEIYIYKNGAWVLHYKNGAWGHYENQDGNQVWVPEEDGEDGEAINKDTVYFQVRAAASQDGAQHKAQVNIWIQPNGSSEWISAYSEVRANYALTIPATN